MNDPLFFMVSIVGTIVFAALAGFLLRKESYLIVAVAGFASAIVWNLVCRFIWFGF